MSGFMDYLEWRGDLPFSSEVPLNEIDNYMIAKICTPDFTGIIPSGKQTVRLCDAIDRYQTKYGDSEYIGALSSKLTFPVIKRMAETKRFSELPLSGYRNKVEKRLTEQFCALTTELYDETYYISFRGTDDTLIAWKENIMMSVDSSIHAREDAVEYLRWAATQYKGNFYVGGHSKGGNLAIYAAAMVEPEIQKRIIKVFSNDGPGFLPSFYETEGYKRIEDRILTILPQHSIVGSLLTQNGNIEVVKCDKIGPGSHDGFGWELKGPSYVHVEGMTKDSIVMNTGLMKVLENMDLETKYAVINEIFEVLKATGASTLTDIAEHKLKQAGTIISSLKSSPETKKFLNEFINAIVSETMPKINMPDFKAAIPKIKDAAESVIPKMKRTEGEQEELDENEEKIHDIEDPEQE